MPIITACTKQLAIIGDPVEHSFSPQMHNYFAEVLGFPYVYTAYHVLPESLEAAISGIRALGIAGINVTAPHKYAVMQYLDEIDPRARLFGSVNTVVRQNGKLIGYNTDADGLYASLLRAECDVCGKDILIFGAGGATQPIALLFALKKAKSITILNRTPEKAERLAAYILEKTGFLVQTKQTLPVYDIIINTTSAGMHPQENTTPITDESIITSETVCVDLIYNPEKTLFLANAEKRGAKIINGLGMLIEQGILAFALFTGADMPSNLYDRVRKEVFLR